MFLWCRDSETQEAILHYLLRPSFSVVASYQHPCLIYSKNSCQEGKTTTTTFWLISTIFQSRFSSTYGKYAHVTSKHGNYRTRLLKQILKNYHRNFPSLLRPPHPGSRNTNRSRSTIYSADVIEELDLVDLIQFPSNIPWSIFFLCTPQSPPRQNIQG